LGLIDLMEKLIQRGRPRSRLEIEVERFENELGAFPADISPHYERSIAGHRMAGYKGSLYGVIIRIRDLGLSLRSVNRVGESHGSIKGERER
jgi:hypothetical protein